MQVHHTADVCVHLSRVAHHHAPGTIHLRRGAGGHLPGQVGQQAQEEEEADATGEHQEHCHKKAGVNVDLAV